VFNTQIDYASNAFADLVDEGQKVVAYLGTMARDTMLNGPMEQPASVPKSNVARKSKQSPHRVASH